MIHLTRINRVPLVLNSDLIEHIEATPDTVITMTTGQKILVLESPETVVDRVAQFRRSIAAQPLRLIGKAANGFSAGPPDRKAAAIEDYSHYREEEE